MYPFFNTESAQAIPLLIITKSDFADFKNTLPNHEANWLTANNFIASPGSICLLANEQGEIAKVYLGADKLTDFWQGAHAAGKLPPGKYEVANLWDVEQDENFALTWGLQAYRFTRYKSNDDIIPQLSVPARVDLAKIENTLAAIYLTRDLINTPAEDMGPSQLADSATKLAKQFDAKINVIVGDDLLTQRYPAVHMVGRAATNAPRLIDLTWGDEHHPKVTLVGKGVCFDTGGLDIKDATGMLLMKKDMGGAAQVLGLASLVMAQQLPVRLRVLIPAVENNIAGNAFRPGDVMLTRKGTTVEIGNTDAEGRLVLADALFEAQSEKPECIIDFATLTGAMRIALGTEIAGYFTNNDALAQKIQLYAERVNDPVWRMPLFQPYRKALDGKIADLSNVGGGSYGGGITAALFLKEFIGETPWVHFDLMAYNLATQPGRREGGEAMGLRAVFEYLQSTYAH